MEAALSVSVPELSLILEKTLDTERLSGEWVMLREGPGHPQGPAAPSRELEWRQCALPIILCPVGAPP